MRVVITGASGNVGSALVSRLAAEPMLDTGRARGLLGWTPLPAATSIVGAFLDGLRSQQRAPAPPLSPQTSRPLRGHGGVTAAGQRP